MILYRVHHKDDIFKGMYRCSLYVSLDMQGDRHPTPCDDDKLSPKWDRRFEVRTRYYFGFSSLDQFASWIYNAEWWQQLEDGGCVISSFKVPDRYAMIGYTQACAIITERRRIKTVPVTRWKELAE